jgi:N-acetylglucosamine kinase-like BadF-type ATPase
MTPKVAKELNKKITHHHATGDPISTSLGKGAVGRVKTYSNSLINPLDKHSIKFFTK